MNNLLRYILIAIGCLLSLTCHALPPEPEDPPEDDDDTQAALRENAITLENPVVEGHISEYPFLNKNANRINLNGDNWDSLVSRLAGADSANFSVVHIGDSHIQADVLTGRIRDNLQNEFGNGGRGLITPFKIAGTNEPYSYTFTATQPVTSAKLLSVPWLSDIRFTGASFTPKTMKYEIGLGTKVPRKPEGTPFNRIRLYSRGRFFIDKVSDDKGTSLVPVVLPTSRYVDIILPVEVTGVKLNMHSFENVSFSGASLNNGSKGVLYHAIGNNGAGFANYNRVEDFGKDVATLNPDLIIINLGTNDAFGKISDDSFYDEMDYMIKRLKRENPNSKFLLVTPMECQKATRRVIRNRKGKRRRYSTTRSYSVNTRVADLAEVIRRYGKENNIPVYDFYEVAGGKGASAKWVNSKLMSKDRIHLSFPGYGIAGDLFSDAIKNALTNQIDHPKTDKENE